MMEKRGMEERARRAHRQDNTLSHPHHIPQSYIIKAPGFPNFIYWHTQHAESMGKDNTRARQKRTGGLHRSEECARRRHAYKQASWNLTK